MKKDKFYAFVEKHTKARHDLMKAKGTEYNLNDDAFDNFKRVGANLDISPVKVLLTYMLKHVDSVVSFEKTGREGTESMTSRVYDIQNYCDLLLGLYNELHNKSQLEVLASKIKYHKGGKHATNNKI